MKNKYLKSTILVYILALSILFTITGCNNATTNQKESGQSDINSTDTINKVEQDTVTPTKKDEIDKDINDNNINKEEEKAFIVGDIVAFGSFPQTEITGENLTSDIVNANYIDLGQGGEATVKGKKYYRVLKTIDEDKKVTDGERFYEYEPIKWKILANKDGVLTLLSEKCLARTYFHMDDSSQISWGRSTLRSYLNGYDATENDLGRDYSLGVSFLENAFSPDEQALILNNQITHSAAGDGALGGNDTNDKINLLSKEEMLLEEYGFELPNERLGYTFSKTREAKPTDYAMALGIEINQDGNCPYWTRSLGYDAKRICYITDRGEVEDSALMYTFGVGFRPVIKISQKDLSNYKVADTDDNSKGISEQNEVDMENRQEGALIAFKDGWIFYSEPALGGALCAVQEGNEKSEPKLIADMPAGNIIVSDDELIFTDLSGAYCIRYNENGNKECRQLPTDIQNLTGYLDLLTKKDQLILGGNLYQISGINSFIKSGGKTQLTVEEQKSVSGGYCYELRMEDEKFSCIEMSFSRSKNASVYNRDDVFSSSVQFLKTSMTFNLSKPLFLASTNNNDIFAENEFDNIGPEIMSMKDKMCDSLGMPHLTLQEAIISEGIRTDKYEEAAKKVIQLKLKDSLPLPEGHVINNIIEKNGLIYYDSYDIRSNVGNNSNDNSKSVMTIYNPLTNTTVKADNVSDLKKSGDTIFFIDNNSGLLMRSNDKGQTSPVSNVPVNSYRFNSNGDIEFMYKSANGKLSPGVLSQDDYNLKYRMDDRIPPQKYPASPYYTHLNPPNSLYDDLDYWKDSYYWTGNYYKPDKYGTVDEEQKEKPFYTMQRDKNGNYFWSKYYKDVINKEYYSGKISERVPTASNSKVIELTNRYHDLIRKAKEGVQDIYSDTQSDKYSDSEASKDTPSDNVDEGDFKTNDKDDVEQINSNLPKRGAQIDDRDICSIYYTGYEKTELLAELYVYKIMPLGMAELIIHWDTSFKNGNECSMMGKRYFDGEYLFIDITSVKTRNSDVKTFEGMDTKEIVFELMDDGSFKLISGSIGFIPNNSVFRTDY